VQAAQIGKQNNQHGKQKHEAERPRPKELLAPRILHASGISEKDDVSNSCADPHQAQVSNEEEFVRERLALNTWGVQHLILLTPFD